MNAQEPAQNRMSVAEKESYVRSAVDASPHKIAIIRWTDDSGAERVLVAWRDQNNNLVFDNKINGVNYSKQPETEFGNPELSGETLNALANSKTIEATPLDFSVKHGANGEVVAKAFMAVVKEERTDTNASNKTEDALQKTIEKVDPSQGVNVRELLQPMWAKLNEANPDAAEAVAKLLLQQFGLAAPEGKAAETLDSFLKSKEFDLVLPRTFVESALEKVWDDIRETFPEEAKDFAERVAKAYIPGAEKSPFAYEKQITQAIPEVVGKAAPSQESWAKENSSRVYSPEQGQWVDAGKQPAEVQTAPPKDSEPEELMGRRHDLQDRIDLLKTAADASPTGVVIVGVSRGSEGPGKLGFDHILVIYKDHKSGEILIAEMMPGNARLPGMVGSVLNSQNNPMPLRQAVRTWDNYTAVPLILTPEQDARFRSSLAKNMSKDNTYSFLTQTGDHCASAVRKALIDAGVWDGREKGIGAYLQKLGINVLLPGTLIEWAKERGGVYYESERFRTSTPDTMDGRDEGASPVGDSYNSTVGTRVDLTGVVNAGDNAELAGLAGANPTLSPEAPLSRQPPTDDDQKPSQQELQDPSDDEDDEDHEDALPGDSPQDPETDEDDDGKDLEEEVRLASDVRPGDAPQQPAIDDDDEDVPTDGRYRQRAADDDDEEPSQGDDEEEEPADASDHEDAPSADAPVMQTAKADAGADVTADDQAGPLLATSAPTPDEGFSFSLFTRPDAPAEVAKEAMPAGQLSPQDPGAGTPAGESAHPDLESQDVGNAAPSKDPVVHHGELAP